jgi:hypothetical protein
VALKCLTPLSLALAVFVAAGCASTQSSEERKISSVQACGQGLDCPQNSASIEPSQQIGVQHDESVSSSSSKDEPKVNRAAGITILEAAFTDRIVNRQPETRVTSWSLKDRGGQAWLWVKVHCTGPCLKKVNSNGKATLSFHWYLETKHGFIKKYSASLPVKGEEWRTWAVKRDLVPGKWKVMIVTDSGQVCSEQGGNCEFLLQVVS